jgi:dihydropteroate synthase
MQRDPFYTDTLDEVTAELLGFVEEAANAGVNRSKIILDPGIGFGKRLSDNLKLIKYIADLRRTGYPVLVGLSRKSFIEKLLGLPVDKRLAASLAAEAYVVLQGVEILRVHDVAETVQLVEMLDAIQKA